MLIDLPLPRNTPCTTFFLEGDVLLARKEAPYPPTFTAEDIKSVRRLPMWQRMAPGIYHGYNLDNYIGAFLSPLRVVPGDEVMRLGFEAVGRAREAGDHAEAERLLQEVFGRPHLYGRAADLEEILKYGEMYVKGPRSYILEVALYDNTDEKSYKQGPFIGKQAKAEEDWVKQPDEVIRFHFYEVVNADGTPFAGGIWDAVMAAP